MAWKDNSFSSKKVSFLNNMTLKSYFFACCADLNERLGTLNFETSRICGGFNSSRHCPLWHFYLCIYVGTLVYVVCSFVYYACTMHTVIRKQLQARHLSTESHLLNKLLVLEYVIILTHYVTNNFSFIIEN